MTQENRDIGAIVGVLIGILLAIFLLYDAVTEGSEATIQENQSLSYTPRFEDIKYRDDSVDIAHPRFESHNTSRSSFIRNAWYDSTEDYMIINLNGVNYHYCGMPGSAWDGFKSASSLGSYYRENIKGDFDCRIHPVPSY